MFETAHACTPSHACLARYPGSEANYRLDIPRHTDLRVTVTTCRPETRIQAAVHLYAGRIPPGCPASASRPPVLLATSSDDFVCGTLFYDLEFRALNASELMIVVRPPFISSYFSPPEFRSTLFSPRTQQQQQQKQ